MGLSGENVGLGHNERHNLRREAIRSEISSWGGFSLPGGAVWQDLPAAEQEAIRKASDKKIDVILARLKPLGLEDDGIAHLVRDCSQYARALQTRDEIGSHDVPESESRWKRKIEALRAQAERLGKSLQEIHDLEAEVLGYRRSLDSFTGPYLRAPADMGLYIRLQEVFFGTVLPDSRGVGAGERFVRFPGLRNLVQAFAKELKKQIQRHSYTQFGLMAEMRWAALFGYSKRNDKGEITVFWNRGMVPAVEYRDPARGIRREWMLLAELVNCFLEVKVVSKVLAKNIRQDWVNSRSSKLLKKKLHILNQNA